MPFYTVLLRGHRVATLRGDDRDHATHNINETFLGEQLQGVIFEGKDLWVDDAIPDLVDATDAEILFWSRSIDKEICDGLSLNDTYFWMTLLIGLVPGLSHTDEDFANAG